MALKGKYVRVVLRLLGSIYMVVFGDWTLGFLAFFTSLLVEDDDF